MKLPIQLLLIASAALSAFSASASSPEISNNLAPKNLQSITGLSFANNSNAENDYARSKLSTSGTVMLVGQLPNSEQTDWTYAILTQPYGDHNLNNYNHFASGIQSVDQPLQYDPVVTSDLSARQIVSALIHDVPLPAAVWLFLGGLLGFLRIQRRPVDS